MVRAQISRLGGFASRQFLDAYASIFFELPALEVDRLGRGMRDGELHLDGVVCPRDEVLFEDAVLEPGLLAANVLGRDHQAGSGFIVVNPNSSQMVAARNFDVRISASGNAGTTRAPAQSSATFQWATPPQRSRSHRLCEVDSKLGWTYGLTVRRELEIITTFGLALGATALVACSGSDNGKGDAGGMDAGGGGIDAAEMDAARLRAGAAPST
jgi:hypothetical protein